MLAKSPSATGSIPTPDLSIIIVSWNTRALLRQCLESIELTHGHVTVETFVIDNASVDGTPEMVNEFFPDVRLIRNNSNVGFARANNLAIPLATGEFVCLINSDVIVPPGCIAGLVAFMRHNPTIGLAGPKMLSPQGIPCPSTMRRPTLAVCLVNALGLASVFPRFSLHVDNMTLGVPTDVDVLNGWFWIARREALDEVGLLDPQFFMYGEDIDWCHRFRNAGWRVTYVPQIAAFHYGGASSARAPIRFYVEMHRANLQYWRKHHGRLSTVVYLTIAALHHAARVVAYGLAAMVQRNGREEATYKTKRSIAFLEWLSNSRLSLTRRQEGAA